MRAYGQSRIVVADSRLGLVSDLMPHCLDLVLLDVDEEDKLAAPVCDNVVQMNHSGRSLFSHHGGGPRNKSNAFN